MFNKKQKKSRGLAPSGVRSTKSRGFTLIELLVVIAIIGLLAGIVLVSLGGSRNAAKDARITAEMGSLRTQAEIYNSAQNPNTYVGFGVSTAIATAVADINAQNGAGTDLVFVESAGGGAYCAKVQMNVDWYCIDNTFVSAKFTTDPSCGAVGDFTCAPGI